MQTEKTIPSCPRCASTRLGYKGDDVRCEGCGWVGLMTALIPIVTDDPMSMEEAKTLLRALRTRSFCDLSAVEIEQLTIAAPMVIDAEGMAAFRELLCGRD